MMAERLLIINFCLRNYFQVTINQTKNSARILPTRNNSQAVLFGNKSFARKIMEVDYQQKRCIFIVEEFYIIF